MALLINHPGSTYGDRTSTNDTAIVGCHLEDNVHKIRMRDHHGKGISLYLDHDEAELLRDLLTKQLARHGR